MEWLKGAMEYLVGLGEVAKAVEFDTVEIKDRIYTRTVFEPVREPVPSSVQLHSLQGLVDYFKALFAVDRVHELEDPGFEVPVALHVVGPRSVDLISGSFGDFRQRVTYATAEPVDGNSFRFGQFMDPETFVVALQSMFVDYGDRKRILEVVGNLTAELVKTSLDDGVTQTVAVRQGIARAAETQITNPVTLAPLRTFADVDQPAGEFILRFRAGDELPKVALFEVDDGRWRREALDRIKGFFAANLPDVPVIV